MLTGLYKFVTMTLKVKRALLRALRATAIIVIVSLTVQVYMTRWRRQPVSLNTAHTQEPQGTFPQTVWDLIRSDRNLTRFTALLSEFDDIVGGLQAPKANFTVYAPVDEAFEQEVFPHDLPWFFWKFLVGYHMGPGGLSTTALNGQNTVPSFVNADIFFKNRQRISVQGTAEAISLNYRASLITPDRVSCFNAKQIILS